MRFEKWYNALPVLLLALVGICDRQDELLVPPHLFVKCSDLDWPSLAASGLLFSLSQHPSSYPQPALLAPEVAEQLVVAIPTMQTRCTGPQDRPRPVGKSALFLKPCTIG